MSRSLQVPLAAALLWLPFSSAIEPESLPPSAPARTTVWSARVAPNAVDSAAAELEAGRPWHAARILAPLRAESALAPPGLLLAARADAGYGNWAGVRRELEAALWLDDEGDGEGWALLGRALEEAREWGSAAAAYARRLTAADTSVDDRVIVEARRARSLARLMDWDAAIEQLGVLSEGDPEVASWSALGLANEVAAAGDVVLTDRLVALIRTSDVRWRAWSAPPTARLARGDSTGALAVMEDALAAGLEPDSLRAEAWRWVGELRGARDDTVAAVEAFREALAAGPRTRAAAAAGEALLAAGALVDAGAALDAARAMDGAGLDEPALDAYDLHAEMLGLDAVTIHVRLARAVLMTRVGGRQEEAAQELRILSEAGEVAAQALDQWGLLRVRQGRVADASTLRERLVGEHPASPEAAEVLYLKGMAAESGGRTAEALSQYERLVENAPTSTRAALAHLRAGRIHLERGARSSAADKFDAYIEAFPDRSGRGEASYWSARARLETGDTVRGRAVLRAFLEHDPIDYYGVIGAELLGVMFDPDFRERAEPPPPPPNGCERVCASWTCSSTPASRTEPPRPWGPHRARTPDSVPCAAVGRRDHLPGLHDPGNQSRLGPTGSWDRVGPAAVERGVSPPTPGAPPP